MNYRRSEHHNRDYEAYGQGRPPWNVNTYDIPGERRVVGRWKSREIYPSEDEQKFVKLLNQ